MVVACWTAISGRWRARRGCEVLPDPANTRAYDKDEGGVAPAGDVVEFGGWPRPPRWMSAGLAAEAGPAKAAIPYRETWAGPALPATAGQPRSATGTRWRRGGAQVSRSDAIKGGHRASLVGVEKPWVRCEEPWVLTIARSWTPRCRTWTWCTRSRGTPPETGRTPTTWCRRPTCGPMPDLVPTGAGMRGRGWRRSA